MKDDLLLQDMERSLQTSKSDLLTGMKQSELYLCRLKIGFCLFSPFNLLKLRIVKALIG